MLHTHRKLFLYGGIFFALTSVILLVVLRNFSVEKDSLSEITQQQTVSSDTPTSPTFIPTSTPVPTQIPSSKQLIGGTQVFQTFNNCGPASLSMALSFLGVRESQQTLGQQIRPYQNTQGDNDDKSVTLAELSEKAKQYGFVTYHRPAGNVELVKRLIAQDLPVITRTWLKPGDDIGHYRVITGYDEATSTFVQDDSLQGANLRYTYQDFLSLWEAFNFEFLVLVPKEKQQQVETVLGEYVDEQNSWRKALMLSDEKLRNNPNDIYALFNKSVAHYYLQDYEQSVRSFEQVESRLPMRMLWYQIEPIMAYYKLGNEERVFQLTNHILSNHNRAFSELYYLQEQIYRQRGDTRSAQIASENAMRYNKTEFWKVNVR